MNFVPKSAFGWVVYFGRMQAGQTWRWQVPQDTPRSQNPNISIWLSGRVVATRDSDGVVTSTRVPGWFSQEQPNISAGDYTLTATEDTTWACITAGTNKNKLPDVSALRLNPGDSFTGGTKVLICYPYIKAVNVQSGCQATEQTYRLVFNNV